LDQGLLDMDMDMKIFEEDVIPPFKEKMKGKEAKLALSGYITEHGLGKSIHDCAINFFLELILFFFFFFLFTKTILLFFSTGFGGGSGLGGNDWGFSRFNRNRVLANFHVLEHLCAKCVCNFK
jgi:hypothetical protein